MFIHFNGLMRNLKSEVAFFYHAELLDAIPEKRTVEDGGYSSDDGERVNI